MVLTICGHYGNLEFWDHDLFCFILYHNINVKYEISFKLVLYFHTVSHLTFYERLPWQPKLPCDSYKNFIYVIGTLSALILSNINDLAQRVHISEINDIFQIYPST